MKVGPKLLVLMGTQPAERVSAWSHRGTEGGFRGALHAKKPLVERSGEEGIQQVLMDESQAQDAPTEAKPGQNTEEAAASEPD